MNEARVTDAEVSRLGDEIFPLLGFLLVSARNLYDEPANYGPRRLMDAARWLLSIIEGERLTESFLVELRQALDAHRYGNSDDEALRELLDQTCLRYARELVEWVDVTPSRVPGEGHPAA